jgi:rubredoxin
MRKNRVKKVLAFMLLIPVLALFTVITGFTLPQSPSASDISSYGDTTGEDLNPDDEIGEIPENGTEEEEEEELKFWICGVCGYVYDGGLTDPETGATIGTPFSELPADWVCPVCGASKGEFEFTEQEQIKDPLVWLAHLEHVLAMRSKHLVVLQRVIDAKTFKNADLHSIVALQNALVSSSKSVIKAQTAIDEYKTLMGIVDELPDGQVINTDATITGEDSSDNGQNGKGNGNSQKENKSNGNENKQNNGKANGKK